MLCFAYGHLEGGTIAVIKKKCLFAGCERRQAFGLEWQKAFALLKPSRRGMIEVINKKCLLEECDKRPAFSLE